jgi:hypothetical protein
MPNTSSYADVIRDWQVVLAAVADHASTMPEAEELRAALEKHMAETVALKAQQDAAKANRQQRTQDLRKMLDEGRELAMRLRGFAKARIGPKSEQISQFGVAPLRKRGRQAAKPQEVPPPKGEPETTPASPDANKTPQ